MSSIQIGKRAPSRPSFRHRLHDVVNHAELPYGYTLAAGTASAVVATVHGRLGTGSALLFLLGAGAGFGLIAAVSAGASAAGPPSAARMASLWNVCAAAVALVGGSGTAHALRGPLAYFATGLVVTLVYFVGAAARSSVPFRCRTRVREPPSGDPRDGA